MTHSPTPTNADDVTVIKTDHDMVDEMDKELGFLTERERPILLAAFARHRITHQSTGEVERLREILKFVSDDGGFPRFSVRLGHGFDSAVLAALMLTGMEK